MNRARCCVLAPLLLVASVICDNCKVSWMESGQEIGVSQYLVSMSIVNTTGDLRTYFPNTRYDVKIKSKFRNHTFTQFYFGVWSKNGRSHPGTLELREKELSRFHNGLYCVSRVIDGPASLAKQSLTVGWQSPGRKGSSCVEFRVAIKETELRYQTANLTVCRDPKVTLDDKGQVLNNCCACGEAKYELVFEGLWSRYTHPRFFPRREWQAAFPTVVGASHGHNYEFWRPYDKASGGLSVFAESGVTLDLELELKSNRKNLNTLLKFRGSNFQNRTSKSYAVLRVTREKHVVSLVAKIEPSPDWFVGVSSLELCQTDCSWIERKSLNLYPYDAGTRNGWIYEDFGDATVPRGSIEHLNMSWPPPMNKKETPFYDKTNNTHNVRPLARLHFKLIRGSDNNNCHQRGVSTDDCTSSWSEWSECSVDCGTGISRRERFVREPYEGNDCDAPLEESRICEGIKRKCPRELTPENCALTDWGDWSKCEKMCGQETIKRSRSFLWNDISKECQQNFGKVNLEEKMDCGNPPCPEDEYLCVDDRYNSWTEWTPCSVTQGNGFKFRFRTIKEHLKRVALDVLDGDIDYGYSACLLEKDDCSISDVYSTDESDVFEIAKIDESLEQTEIDNYRRRKNTPDECFLPADSGYCEDGKNANSHRYYYDKSVEKCLPYKYSGCGGNANRFNDERSCIKKCVIRGRKIDCVMSQWGSWSTCSSCNGFRVREKTILIQPENGGRMCPLSKVHRESCKSMLPYCS